MKHIKLFENFDSAFAKAVNQGIPKPSKEFWEFVDKVDWKNKKKYKGDELIETVAPYFESVQVFKFEKEYNEIYDYMKKRYNSLCVPNNILNVSDDGYSDLLSSVIGYGREFCLNIIKDSTNKILIEMSLNLNYTENFGYIFHYMCDTKEQIKEWDRIYYENKYR